MAETQFTWGLIGYGDLAEKRVAAALKATGALHCVWGRSYDKARDFAGTRTNRLLSQAIATHRYRLKPITSYP